MTKENNKRVCRSCGKLIHEHSEEQLKTCARKNDKLRQLVGRRAFHQCCLINPTNPDAPARNIERLFEEADNISTLNAVDLDMYDFDYLRNILADIKKEA